MLSEHLDHLVRTSHRSGKVFARLSLSFSLSLSAADGAVFFQALEDVLGVRTSCRGASNEMLCVFEQLFWICHFHSYEGNT